MDLYSYIKSGRSIIFLRSFEESRAELSILKTVEKLNGGKKKKYGLKIWSCTEGFSVPGTKEKEPCEDPIAALMAIKNDPEGTIIILRDFHMFMGNPKAIRLIRDIARDFKQQQKCLILLSPINKIPAELEKDLTVIEFDLPKKEEIEFVAKTLYKTSGAEEKFGVMLPDEFERLTQACGGLTLVETENVVAKALVDFGINEQKTPISKLVMTEKADVVKKAGILEFVEAKETKEDIGGLDNFKAWMQTRSRVFSKEARAYKLPFIKGIALVGIPGCGKSLCAKAAASILGVPLLVFDVGRVFGSLVGDSERNMRSVIQTIEAVGSCVVLLDELDKGFAGMGSSNSGDSGTSQRVFGTFLTYLQNKTSPSFVVATINRIEGLPPELLRKGRFDEIFFVGLPSTKERENIFTIQIKKYGRDALKMDKKIIQECIKVSKGFSGAEIEEAVVSALFNAFAINKEVDAGDILLAVKNTNPLSKSRAEDLKQMTAWAKANAVNASKVEVDDSSEFVGGRQIDL